MAKERRKYRYTKHVHIQRFVPNTTHARAQHTHTAHTFTCPEYAGSPFLFPSFLLSSFYFLSFSSFLSSFLPSATSGHQ